MAVLYLHLLYMRCVVKTALYLSYRINDKSQNMTFFLCLGHGHLRLYPEIEILILPMLSYPGFHVILTSRCCVTFPWTMPQKHLRMQRLMMSKKKNPLFI